jgi:hypothetical protein
MVVLDSGLFGDSRVPVSFSALQKADSPWLERRLGSAAS